MNIKHLFSSVLMMLCLPAMGQQVCLETDFCDGIPEDFTLICYDEMPINSIDFKKLNASMEWNVSLVNSKDGVAAVSASRRLYDMPTDNWMITPRLTLPTENPCLKWTSRAIHYHLRDGYKVMISTTGNEYYDFEELYSVEEEEYLWTKHCVSLEKYAGKKVYIAFVHNSQNKFLLAIDDMFVGQPSESDFVVKDETPRFIGNDGTVEVKIRATNSGIKEGRNLNCVVNGKDTITLESPAGDWMVGEEREYRFGVLAELGKTINYEVLTDEGFSLVKDSIICSYYPRTILLEKATGTWCINCPEVISYIQELEERYGQNIVCVEAHWGPETYGKDPFHHETYTGMSGMKTTSFPVIHFNRDRSNVVSGGDAKSRMVLGKIINKPTIAKVDMSLDAPVGDSVKAMAKVTFAIDTDNSTGKYRVGFVLIEKSIQTDLTHQINGASSVAHHGEYYYLKSPVATDLMWYTNVVRNENKAFLGIKNSLPAVIEGGVEYTVDAKMGIPASVFDRNNLALVAIVMNYYTDEVLNVVEVKVPEDPSNIQPIGTVQPTDEIQLAVNGEGELFVASPIQTPFTVEVVAVDGRQVATWTGEGSASFKLTTRGLYVLRICQDGRTYTKKVIF